jgi:hypothetical protein
MKLNPTAQVALEFKGGKIVARFGPPPSDTPVEIDQKPTGTGKFYVYVHRNPSGQIFYVGKGTGRRAWSDQRHSVWHKYVQERCGGTYTVQIVSYHEGSDEAEESEGRLITLNANLIIRLWNDFTPPGTLTEHLLQRQSHWSAPTWNRRWSDTSRPC